MSRPDPRRRRQVATVIALVALLAPLVVSLTLLARSLDAQSSFAQAEADGIAYLRPVVRLIAASADAQSATVSGRPLDTAEISAARADVEAVDRRTGSALGTARRWDDLGAALDSALGSSRSPQAAYAEWRRVIDLELALVAAVGDGAQLVHDPGLDSYYLIQAATTRLPRLVVVAGRISDLSRLAGASGQKGAGKAADQSAATDLAARARSELIAEFDGLDRELGVALNSTSSPTLGPAMLALLDRLREAVADLAPSRGAFGAAQATQSARVAEQGRSAVRDAAVALDVSALDQIDSLLTRRTEDVNTRLRLVVGLAGVAVVGLAIAARVLAGARRLERVEDDLTTSTSRPTNAPDGLDDVVVAADDLSTGRSLVRAGRVLSSSREHG